MLQVLQVAGRPEGTLVIWAVRQLWAHLVGIDAEMMRVLAASMRLAIEHSRIKWLNRIRVASRVVKATLIVCIRDHVIMYSS
jgi:hypothetical protein